jgi:N-acetylmuramoyl-L-alanine amidase
MPRLSLLRSVAAVGALLFVGQATFAQPSAPKAVTVKPGDTLWGLSIRYHVDVNQFAGVNGMKLSDVLFAGRTLTLPGTGGATSAPATKSTPPPPPPRHFTAAELVQMRSFCASYRPPTGPVGVLPIGLRGDAERLALRPLFVKWARAYGVPSDLAEAIAWQESGWQNDVVSPADAHGIGQLLPETAAFVNGLLGTRLQLTVPDDNIRMEIRFLALLLRATGGQVCGAVASYYQGFGTLRQIGVLPESQVYVRNVLSLRPRFR